MVNSSTTDTGKAAVQFGKPREEPGIMLLKEVFGKGDKAKDTQANRNKRRKHGENPNPRQRQCPLDDKSYIHSSGWKIMMTTRECML